MGVVTNSKSKWVLGALALTLTAGTLMGGNCSRERVESMNAMNEGVDLAERKNWSGAVKQLEKSTVLDPTNHQAFYNLAIARMELRNFEAAEEALESAVAVAPDQAGYSEKLGTVRMELEDWEGARDAFRSALGKDDSLFKGHFKLGRVHEHLEDSQNALHSYTAAIMKGPRFLPSYAALGRMYADLRYPDNAAQVLDEGLKVAVPKSEEEANLRHLLGTVYQQQGKFDGAIEEFQEALGIASGMGDALFSLGWTYSLKGNAEEARRYLQRFVNTAGPDTPEWYKKAARDRISELKLE